MRVPVGRVTVPYVKNQHSCEKVHGRIDSRASVGIIISVMEDGEFPGWLNMILCVLATVIPAGVINLLLPSGLFFVGSIVGAITGGIAISALCGMSLKRASIAAGIYLVIQIGIALLLGLAFESLA
jgi:hypothetical protein